MTLDLSLAVVWRWTLRAVACLCAGVFAVMSYPAAVSAQADGPPASELVLEIRKGQLLRLERPAAAVFVADPLSLLVRMSVA